MNTVYKTTRHAMFSVKYHFAWTPGFKKGILDNEAVVALINESIVDVASKFQFDILDMTIKEDRILLSVDALPRYSPAEIINKVKGTVGLRIGKQFPELKVRGKIWTNAYFCVTSGELNMEDVDEYIQKKWSKLK